MRVHGVTVSNIPKKIDITSSHTIIANVHYVDELIILPLKLKGVISYLDTENPGDQHKNCRRINLTSNSIWKAYSDSFHRQESMVTSSVTCQNSVEQHMISDFMQISLKDTSDADKLQ